MADDPIVLSEPSKLPCEKCGDQVTLPDDNAIVESVPTEPGGDRLRAWHGQCYEDFLDQNEET